MNNANKKEIITVPMNNSVVDVYDFVKEKIEDAGMNIESIYMQLNPFKTNVLELHVSEK